MKHVSYDQVVEAVEFSYIVEDFIHMGDKVRFVFDSDMELAEIDICIVGHDEMRHAQGCHSFPDDFDDLTHSIHTQLEHCFRDGFTTIYIHKAA